MRNLQYSSHTLNLSLLAIFSILLLGLGAPLQALPQGSVFTYQGQLFDGGLPAGGSYDFELRLYDAAASGSLEAGPVSISAVPVSAGYFNLDVDFSTVFSGDLLFMEIKVRPAGGGSYTTLSPRQALQSVPNALYAADADTLDGLDSSDFLAAGATVNGGIEFSETLVTNDDSVVSVLFDHGVGSIGGFGLQIVGGLLEDKGTLIAFEGSTGVDDVGHPQAGRALARGAVSSGFDAQGIFQGVRGHAWAESLSNFGGAQTSQTLGGLFYGQSESGAPLALNGIGTYWVGGTYGEVRGEINGTPSSGAVAGVIGVDSQTGSATSWAGYFHGDVYVHDHIGLGTSDTPNILTVVQGSATDPIADAWTVWSSRRYKDDIQTLGGALEAIRSLRGVTWRWKHDQSEDLGLVAEEVGAVFPQLVAWEDNGVDAKGVDYSRLVAVLIEAVKEQQVQIDALSAALAPH